MVCAMQACQAQATVLVSPDIKVQTVTKVSLLLLSITTSIHFHYLNPLPVMSLYLNLLPCVFSKSTSCRLNPNEPTSFLPTCYVAEIPGCAAISCNPNSSCSEDPLTGQVSCQCRPGFRQSGEKCLCKFVGLWA